MRLIDAEKLFDFIQKEKAWKQDYMLRYRYDKGKYDAYYEMLDIIKEQPTIDVEPVDYQLISKNFARMITKAIANLLSELHLDLPSLIYEDIESNLLKGKFADVECFVQNYIANNGAKMDEEQG